MAGNKLSKASLSIAPALLGQGVIECMEWSGPEPRLSVTTCRPSGFGDMDACDVNRCVSPNAIFTTP